jgi:hypothetical protein
MNTLVIIGNGPSREGAPKLQPGLDVWMVNNHALYSQRRITGLFEMHPNPTQAERYQQDYKDWLQQAHPFPIYMHQVDEHIPASRRYPLREVQSLYGRGIFLGKVEIADHFSSTFPYMLALALFQHYRQIKVYGVDLETGTEYAVHRAHVYFWLGVASASNVCVEFPESSRLIEPAYYPFF